MRRNSKKLKNKFTTFESDDSQGSDLSFQSSQQDQDLYTGPHDKQKGLLMFKQQMSRFFISNPQLKNLKFDTQQQQPQPQNLWSAMTLNVLKQAKSVQQTPSIENFTKRLNLFKNKVERYDLIDQILKDEQKLMSQIQNEIANKKKNELSIHQRAQAIVRKQTGVLNFFSKCKRDQFELRVQKAQQKEIHLSKRKTNLKKKSQKIIQSNLLNKDQKTNIHLPDIQLKSQAGRMLLDRIKNLDEEHAKKQIIQFLGKHRIKTRQQFKGKQSLLQQGYRYYPEDSKQFLLLYPNAGSKKKVGSNISQDFLQQKKQLQTGNNYLLHKMNKILNGALIKHWKSMRQQKI